MRESNLVYDVLFPALIYGVFGIMGIICASRARSARRAIRKNAVFAEAQVTGYSSYIARNGRFRVRCRDVTVVCTPPQHRDNIRFIITTQGHFTFRYRWVKRVRLSFLPDGTPVLPEDKAQLGFDGTAGFVAGILLLLFALLAVVGCFAGLIV